MSDPVHWFYVLYSLKDGKCYKGTCSDLGERYLNHVMGVTTSTKHRRPLILIYIKKFDCKSEALAFERFSKSLSGGIELREKLVEIGILNSIGRLNQKGRVLFLVGDCSNILQGSLVMKPLYPKKVILSSRSFSYSTPPVNC